MPNEAFCLRPVASDNSDSFESFSVESSLNNLYPKRHYGTLPDSLKLFADQLNELAEQEDIKFLDDPYWRDLNGTPLARYYRFKPLYFFAEKSDLETQLDLLRVNKLMQMFKSPSPNQCLTVVTSKGKKMQVSATNIKKINKYLIPQGWLYSRSVGNGGKTLYILGKIISKRHINGYTAYTIGEEAVSNHNISVQAFMQPDRKIVVGREKASEFFMWRQIYIYKNDKSRNTYSEFLARLGLEKLLGMTEQEMLTAKPEEMAQKVKKAARLLLEEPLAHENGHIAQFKKPLPKKIYVKALEYSMKEQYRELEYFAHALADAIADTIVYRKIKGRYSAVAELDRDVCFGILCLNFAKYLDRKNPVIKEREKLTWEFLPAFLEYAKTGDIQHIYKANETIANKLKGYIELLDKGAYEDWIRVMVRAEAQFDNNKNEVCAAIDNLKKLKWNDIASSLRTEDGCGRFKFEELNNSYNIMLAFGAAA
ncbi:MAG: hypothetical protein V2A72_00800 [Candidatus Omnitrophota bacterium]